MKEKIFETENLYYVKVNKKYLSDYLKMMNDYEVAKFISHNFKKYSQDEELEWIEKQKDNNLIFSIIEKKSNTFVGNIELRDRSNCYELGIIITSEKQNRGYGTEIIKRIIKYAEEELNIKELFLKVFKNNERAIHVYEKTGFIELDNDETSGEITMKYTK